LGSFPTESRAEIFPQCRQDCPLPPPINRGGVDGLREEKIELKVGWKPAFPAHFSCNRSFLCLISPPWLSATTIFITRLLSIILTSSSHQTISRGGCTTSLSLSSVKIFFSATVTSLNSSNSRSSGQHLAQKPSSFPKTARVAALSPATPTTPTASFPSPLQALFSSSSSGD